MNCIKCNQKINPTKDMYHEITTFNGLKIIEKIYFHKQCYKDFFKDKFREEYEKKMKIVTPLLKNTIERLRLQCN